jgi:hypothetical protein
MALSRFLFETQQPLLGEAPGEGHLSPRCGSPAWIRTTIHGSKGRCPTIRRPGNTTKCSPSLTAPTPTLQRPVTIVPEGNSDWCPGRSSKPYGGPKIRWCVRFALSSAKMSQIPRGRFATSITAELFVTTRPRPCETVCSSSFC